MTQRDKSCEADVYLRPDAAGRSGQEDGKHRPLGDEDDDCRQEGYDE